MGPREWRIWSTRAPGSAPFLSAISSSASCQHTPRPVKPTPNRLPRSHIDFLAIAPGPYMAQQAKFLGYKVVSPLTRNCSKVILVSPRALTLVKMRSVSVVVSLRSCTLVSCHTEQNATHHPASADHRTLQPTPLQGWVQDEDSAGGGSRQRHHTRQSLVKCELSMRSLTIPAPAPKLAKAVKTSCSAESCAGAHANDTGAARGERTDREEAGGAAVGMCVGGRGS
jgi:hypothetical protein